MTEENKNIFDHQLVCPHQFFDLGRSNDKPRHEAGDEVWFYCDKCLITVMRHLVDQSEKL